MKYVLMLIGVFGMFIVGYLSEPTLRGMMTRDPAKAAPAAPVADAAKQNIEVAAEIPPSAPDASAVVDEEAELVDGDPTGTAEATDAAKQSIDAVAEMPPSAPDASAWVDEETELVDGDPTETDESAEAEIPAEPAADGGTIHQIMQRSLLDSEVTHFTVAQVIEVKDVGQTVINGVQYQFGIIDYRENTIFGERVYQAQALIRDGKVEKWIWPSNGMKIP